MEMSRRLHAPAALPPGKNPNTLLSGFRRAVDTICGLLGYYISEFLFGILTREDETDTLSRNVGK
jgi:hypothetical protein